MTKTKIDTVKWCFTFFMLGLVLSSCKSGQKRSEKKLFVALSSPPVSLNPTQATDATGMRTLSLIFQSLVEIDSQLEVSPNLAHRWEVQGANYKFFISNKILFSDGSSLGCKEITQSIKSYQEQSPFQSVFSKIKNAKCTEKKEDLILTFNLPQASLKFLLADLPVLKIFKETSDKKTLGSGPFRIAQSEASKLILTPNTYYKNSQKYDIHFAYIKDDFVRFLKTYKGEIDVAPNSIPFEKIESFENTPFSVIETSSLSSSYLLINFKNKFLQNRALRLKIKKSLNINDLILNRFNNHVTPSRSLLAPVHPYYPQDLNSIKLKAQTQSANLGKPLILKTSNSRQSLETGKILAQRLREKGIPVLLQSFEWGTFYRDIKNGNYDLALMKWVGVVDPDQYNIAFHSQEFPPGRNRGYYSNLDLDKILDRAARETQIEKRKELYAQVQRIIYKDIAIISLWHENQIHITHPRIKNYQVNPMGDFSSLLNLRIQNESN